MGGELEGLWLEYRGLKRTIDFKWLRNGLVKTKRVQIIAAKDVKKYQHMVEPEETGHKLKPKGKEEYKKQKASSSVSVKVFCHKERIHMI